ncbi:spermidine synthase [Egibacter rhizosphaerae]|uniref:Spermidine synthase n=1 Tax=Egibacter rhizosphaerae TaxID=1670831 RepID=A0A411YJ55_9ACTN|nr:spermidine synthase [Egibacter rhizosphaerae]QBI21335.1 spermidine synthase [Egibacter rhizosphaerae]
MTPDPDATARVLERVTTPRGEFALRQRGGDLELIADGVFLMSTAASHSERELGRLALAAHPSPRRVLVAGLGLGVTVAAVLADPRVHEVLVVEIEPVVVRWQRTHAAEAVGPVLDDPRVRVEIADVTDIVRGSVPMDPSDVVCLDVDNGPGWTLYPSNAWLYDATGLAGLAGLLGPGGVLAVWASAEDPTFATRLGEHVGPVTVHERPVPRGAPDVLLLAGQDPVADPSS